MHLPRNSFKAFRYDIFYQQSDGLPTAVRPANNSGKRQRRVRELLSFVTSIEDVFARVSL